MDMNNEKTYSAGSDSAGGFAVPTGWSNGSVDASPDPVIEEANTNAKESAEKQIALPPHFMAYTKLPKNNDVRRQAEKMVNDYKFLMESANNEIPTLTSAKRVLTKIRSDISSFQSRADKQSSGFATEWQTWGARRLYELSKLPRTVSSTIKDIENISDFMREDDYDDAKISEAAIDIDNTIDNLDEAIECGGTPAIQQMLDAEKEKMVKFQDAIHSELIRLDIARKQLSNEDVLQKEQLEFDDIKEQDIQQDTTVPDNVPEYRLAIASSPRVCGNCRFFNGKASVYGKCTAYDFTAKANYVCNAWQSMSLTSDHTPVRDANIRGSSMQRKTVEYADPHPSQSDGHVPGQQFIYNTIGETPLENTEEVDFSDSAEFIAEENAALRAHNQDFLPGDVVYSTALRTMARVDSRMKMDGILVYGLKLLNPNGTYWGSGYTYGDDLQSRSGQATKAAFVAGGSNRNMWTYKTDDEEMSIMINDTRAIYKAIKRVLDDHADILVNPLKNTDLIHPLIEDVTKVLEKPEWRDKRTGPMRKYYRAVQSAGSALGAAQEILFKSHKQIVRIYRGDGHENPASKSAMRRIMLKAQTDAYKRIEDAFKFVSDSLTMPSATHNIPAPGVGNEGE